MQGRAARSTTLEVIASALDLELYIGPARAPLFAEDRDCRRRSPTQIGLPRDASVADALEALDRDALASRLRRKRRPRAEPTWTELGDGRGADIRPGVRRTIVRAPGARQRTVSAMIPFAPAVRLAAGSGEIVFDESPEMSIAVATDALVDLGAAGIASRASVRYGRFDGADDSRRLISSRSTPAVPNRWTDALFAVTHRRGARRQAPAAVRLPLAAGQRQSRPRAPHGGRRRPDPRGGRVVRAARAAMIAGRPGRGRCQLDRSGTLRLVPKPVALPYNGGHSRVVCRPRQGACPCEISYWRSVCCWQPA